MSYASRRPLSTLVVGLAILILIGVSWLVSDRPPNLTDDLLDLSETNQVPESEGDLSDNFTPLIIPYLRSRKYQSSLGSLERVSASSNFTTYLTSYDSDGLKINALMTVPNGEKPEAGWPAIVFVHGYIPPSQYKTQEKYIDYINYLARNGFVVLKIDLRGHGQSEGEPTGSYYSGGYVIDTLNAVSALQSSDLVNPQAIGLWGHSMAGNIVLRSLVAKPDLPAVVIWAGAGFSYSDLQKYGLNDNSYRRPSTSTPSGSMRQQLFDKYGQFNAESEFWRQVAPTNYLSDVKGAIQLHHAVDDSVVNVGYSQDLNALLDDTQIPHEFYSYTAGGHNISGASFTQAMKRTVEFYGRYLGGGN